MNIVNLKGKLVTKMMMVLIQLIVNNKWKTHIKMILMILMITLLNINLNNDKAKVKNKETKKIKVSIFNNPTIRK